MMKRRRVTCQILIDVGFLAFNTVEMSDKQCIEIRIEKTTTM